MMYVAASIVALAGLLGVVLTLVTLPGIWIMILVALVCQYFVPDLFSWWTLGIAIGLGVLGEIVEFFASAAGAAKAKGSKSAMSASLVGGIIGAILGTVFLPFLPIIGTVLGGVAGAGLGAGIAERGIAGKPWDESLKVAQGAATGKALSIVAKTAVAGVAAAVLITAAFVP